MITFKWNDFEFTLVHFGKGVKKNPDTFHVVSKDAWQAIAVAVTHYEIKEVF